MSDNKENFRQEECLRFMEWMIQNRRAAYAVFRTLEGTGISREQALEVLRAATENEFYFLLPLLLRKIAETGFGEQLLAVVCMNHFGKGLNLSDFCRELLEELQK